jgi:hypothetical protein
MTNSILATCTVTSAALGCGTPPSPPPPPPDPPVVCCRISSWFIDPVCNKEVLILCYFREDGLPLYISNPMPLPFTQQCACGFTPLPTLPGVMDGGITFGPPSNPFDSCDILGPDQPGYGPFTPLCEPQTAQQIDSFFDVFYNVAKIPPRSGPCPRQSTVFSFRGPGQIQPGVPFVVYRKVIVPRGFDPNVLCSATTSNLSAIGLFLVDNGTPFIEPPAAGLPPIPFSQFSQNPGASAMYKVKCLPLDLPGPCPFPCPVPPFCAGDADGNGFVNFADITATLANFGRICP